MRTDPAPLRHSWAGKLAEAQTPARRAVRRSTAEATRAAPHSRAAPAKRGRDDPLRVHDRSGIDDAYHVVEQPDTPR